jgi:hypothetical protein
MSKNGERANWRLLDEVGRRGRRSAERGRARGRPGMHGDGCSRRWGQLEKTRARRWPPYLVCSRPGGPAADPAHTPPSVGARGKLLETTSCGSTCPMRRRASGPSASPDRSPLRTAEMSIRRGEKDEAKRHHRARTKAPLRRRHALMARQDCCCSRPGTRKVPSRGTCRGCLSVR